jgi:hypothetical protein
MLAATASGFRAFIVNLPFDEVVQTHWTMDIALARGRRQARGSALGSKDTPICAVLSGERSDIARG